MDYTELAVELIQKMKVLHRAKSQKNMNGALQGEQFVLHYLLHQGGDVLPGEISNEMDVSSARVATALNSLENKGLITRQIDKSDRRRIIVSLTAKGRDAAKKHKQAIVQEMAEVLALLGEEDAKEFIRIIGRLVEIAPNHKHSI